MQHIIRRSRYAVAIMLLLLVACKRQPPPIQKEATPSTPSSTVGTTGTSAPAAQTATQSQSAPAPTEAMSGTMERDADAVAALERMGSYLRTLTAFQVQSETSRDDVLDDGQKVQFNGTVDMLVRRPNRLRAEVITDKQHRMYFDDGTNFSVWARRMNYYAQIPAPATLHELADMLTDKYDIELPLVDLFYWGERKNTQDIKGAMNVGPSQVDGVTCQHYTFRQDGADWQVWIQQGDYPLPRRLVITTTSDPARPQFATKIAWNLAPSYNDDAFKFVPPKDSKKISLAPIMTATTTQ